MKQSHFPPGWDEKRVQAVLEHYENQTEEEAVAEDEAAFEQTETVMQRTVQAKDVAVWDAAGVRPSATPKGLYPEAQGNALGRRLLPCPTLKGLYKRPGIHRPPSYARVPHVILWLGEDGGFGTVVL